MLPSLLSDPSLLTLCAVEVLPYTTLTGLTDSTLIVLHHPSPSLNDHLLANPDLLVYSDFASALEPHTRNPPPRGHTLLHLHTSGAPAHRPFSAEQSSWEHPAVLQTNGLLNLPSHPSFNAPSGRYSLFLSTPIPFLRPSDTPLTSADFVANPTLGILGDSRIYGVRHLRKRLRNRSIPLFQNPDIVEVRAPSPHFSSCLFVGLRKTPRKSPSSKPRTRSGKTPSSRFYETQQVFSLNHLRNFASALDTAFSFKKPSDLHPLDPEKTPYLSTISLQVRVSLNNPPFCSTHFPFSITQTVRHFTRAKLTCAVRHVETFQSVLRLATGLDELLRDTHPDNLRLVRTRHMTQLHEALAFFPPDLFYSLSKPLPPDPRVLRYDQADANTSRLLLQRSLARLARFAGFRRRYPDTLSVPWILEFPYAI